MSTNTDAGITRDQAMALLETYLQNPRLISHCVATEAIMRSLARKYAENETIWGLSGLLHDLDYQITGEDSATHGLETRKNSLREKCIANNPGDYQKAQC